MATARNLTRRRTQIEDLNEYYSPSYEIWAGKNLGLIGHPLSTSPAQLFSISYYHPVANTIPGWIMIYDVQSTIVDGAWTLPSGLGILPPIAVTPGGPTIYVDWQVYRQTTRGLFIVVSEVDTDYTPWAHGPGGFFLAQFTSATAPSP